MIKQIVAGKSMIGIYRSYNLYFQPDGAVDAGEL